LSFLAGITSPNTVQSRLKGVPAHRRRGGFLWEDSLHPRVDGHVYEHIEQYREQQATAER